MRRRVTQTELAELRKRTPRVDRCPAVGVIVRRIVGPDPAFLGMPPLPIAPEEGALIAATMAEFQQDRKVRRLILDNALGAVAP
jgi:hypothetical protein